MVQFPSPNFTGFFHAMLFLLFIMLIGHCCGQKVPPDKKDEWKPCNWKNMSNDPKNANKIFFTEDNCETYLICYKSKLDPATQLGGKAKLSRRFWVQNKNAEYLNCRRGDESLDDWHAVKKSKAFGDRANAESKNGEFLEDFANFDLAAWEFTRNDPTKCRAKCALTASALAQRIDHQNTSCTEITIPLDTPSFFLNISFYPRLLCKDPAYARGYSKWKNDPVKVKEKLSHACDYAPMKCQNNNTFELFMCYNSTEKASKVVNKKIANRCEKHLNNGQNQNIPNVHGVLVGVCIRRVNISAGNELFVEAYVQMSFSEKSYNYTRRVLLDYKTKPEFNYAMKRKQLMLIKFENDFGTIYEMPDQKVLIKESAQDEFGLGHVFSQINKLFVNGNWVKQLHFVPPEDPVIHDQIVRIYFQMENPSVFSTMISKTKTEDWKNDPKKPRPTNKCDLIENCEEVRKVLLEMRKILTWCNPYDPSGTKNIDPAEFTIPPWVQRPKPKSMPESHTADGDDDPIENNNDDIIYDLKQVQSDLYFLKQRCGMFDTQDEEAQKRQAAPYIDSSKWDQFPIQVKLEESLADRADDYEWIELVEYAFDSIQDRTCVSFEFDVRDPKLGGLIITEQNDKPCGSSQVGHVKDWLDVKIKKAMGCFTRGVVAHELLHALGLKHEQARSDAYEYIKINWAEIDKNNHNYQLSNTKNYGFPYDFGSVMHYHGYNRKKDIYGIITLQRFYQQTIGQDWQPSFKDLKIINKLYCEDRCAEETMRLEKCQNGGFHNPKTGCSVCYCPEGYAGALCEQLAEDFKCYEMNSLPREYVADWRTRTLAPKIDYTFTKDFGEFESNSYLGIFSKCHWRIKPKPGEKVIIKLKRLDDSFYCTWACYDYVEIKYRTDKSAAGVRLCCSEALQDANNWIEAEEPGQEIVIFTHISLPITAIKKPSFELTFETDGAKIEPASNCPNFIKLYKKERNPGTEIVCTDVNGKEVPCPDDDRTNPIHNINCPGVLFINDQREVRRRNASHVFHFECLKKTDESQSFWGYWKDKNGDPIRVGEVQCVLRYEDAGLKTDEDIDKVAVDP